MSSDSFADSGAIYINRLLTYLLTYLLIYFLKNRPVPFPRRRSYEATKPGFSFCFVFIMCCSIFCYECMFAFVVLDLVFRY